MIGAKRRILVYDVDAGNPYGREIGALLVDYFEVEVLVPVDTEWAPQLLRCTRCLPASHKAWLPSQLWRQVASLLIVAWAALLQRRTIVVVMTRSWYDDALLALIGLFGGHMVVIAHDPVPKRPLSRARSLGRKCLWSTANVLVSHSRELADQAGSVGGRRGEVIPHLPFTEYSAWAREVAPDRIDAKRKRLLLLGRVSPDKGLERLPSILRQIDDVLRRKLSLSFAGRGSIDGYVAELSSLVTVAYPPSPELVTDRDIAGQLAEADICIAPYRVVSASGSVVLALSRGLPVVAYDVGALREVVADNGLVPVNDEVAFAGRIAAMVNSPCSTSRYQLGEWRGISLVAWTTAIEQSWQPGRGRNMQ